MPRYTKPEWMALFLSELAQERTPRLSPRIARALAVQALARHPDLSPGEASRLLHSDAIRKAA